MLTLDGPRVLDEYYIQFVRCLIYLVQIHQQLTEYCIIYVKNQASHYGWGSSSMKRLDLFRKGGIFLYFLGLFLISTDIKLA
jgi:hypothetical protein